MIFIGLLWHLGTSVVSAAPSSTHYYSDIIKNDEQIRREEAAYDTLKQALILVKPNTRQAVVRKLPAGVRALDQTGNLILLRSKNTLTRNTLLRIRQIPGVRRVWRDRLVFHPTEEPVYSETHPTKGLRFRILEKGNNTVWYYPGKQFFDFSRKSRAWFGSKTRNKEDLTYDVLMQELTFLKLSPEDLAALDQALARAKTGTPVTTPSPANPDDCDPGLMATPTPDPKIGELINALNPKKCSLSEVCANNGKERLWAQRRMDADLMQDAVYRFRTSGIKTRISVVDTGFDQNLKDAVVSPVDTRYGVYEKDKEIETSNPSGGTRTTGISKDPGPSPKPVTGDPTKDIDGHGTMCSGAILGKGGMGVAPNATMSVYRLTKDAGPMGSGSTSSALLWTSVYRACTDMQEQGEILPVISLSWGGRYDEMGEERDEVEMKELLAEMATKGCLIVKAAGNSAFRNQNKTDNLDDNYLRVAAEDPSGNLSYFSTAGEVAAPGAGVFTLESTVINETKKIRLENHCGDIPHAGFVSGTSFSAPLVAGIASEINGILKSAPSFAQLKPEERIQLVNRILKASMVNGSVNGLRAVHIADRWNKAAGQSITQSIALTPEQLSTLLAQSPDPVCSSAAEPCNGKDCKKLVTCVGIKRSAIAICEPPRADSALELFGVYKNGNALESAVQYLKIGRAKAQISEKTYATALSDIINRYIIRWSHGFNESAASSVEEALSGHNAIKNLQTNIDVNILQEFFLDYIKTRDKKSNADKQKVSQLLRALLGSEQLTKYLKRGPERGSEEKAVLLANMIRAAQDLLGVDALVSILGDTNKQMINDLKVTPDSDNIFITARLFNEILDPAKNTGFQPKLIEQVQKMENDFYTQLKQTDRVFGNKTSRLGIKEIFFGEIHNNRAYLEPMIKRHETEILASLQGNDAGRIYKNLGNYSTLQVSYILDSMLAPDPSPFKPDEKQLIFKSILSRLANGVGWDQEGNILIFSETLDLMKKSGLTNAELKPLMNDLVSQTKSLDFLGILLKTYHNHELNQAFKDPNSIFKTLSNSGTSTALLDLLTREQINEVSRRLAIAFTHEQSPTDDRIAQIIPHVSRMMIQLQDNLGKEGDQALVAPVGKSYLIPQGAGRTYGRLNPIDFSRIQNDTVSSLPNISATMESLASWALKLYREGLPVEDARFPKLKSHSAAAVLLDNLILKNSRSPRNLLFKNPKAPWVDELRLTIQVAEKGNHGGLESFGFEKKTVEKLKEFLKQVESGKPPEEK